jgi:hypothetical protein
MLSLTVLGDWTESLVDQKARHFLALSSVAGMTESRGQEYLGNIISVDFSAEHSLTKASRENKAR